MLWSCRVEDFIDYCLTQSSQQSLHTSHHGSSEGKKKKKELEAHSPSSGFWFNCARRILDTNIFKRFQVLQMMTTDVAASFILHVRNWMFSWRRSSLAKAIVAQVSNLKSTLCVTNSMATLCVHRYSHTNQMNQQHWAFRLGKWKHQLTQKLCKVRVCYFAIIS